METGTIKFVDKQKGYGMISPAVGLSPILFQIKDCLDEVRENDSVKFDVITDKKGKSAKRVILT